MAYIDTAYLGKCETCRHHRSGGCDTWCENGECYRPDMLRIPTADVEEVKRGYWKKRVAYPAGYNCSECNNSETYKSPFCRMCGTKMDGTPQKEG